MFSLFSCWLTLAVANFGYAFFNAPNYYDAAHGTYMQAIALIVYGMFWRK